MKYLFVQLLILILIVLCAPVLSWSAQLSLSDVIVLGLRTNTQLQIEGLNIDKARHAIIIEEAAFDPRAFSILGYDQNKSPFAGENFSGRLSTREYQGSIGLRKDFTTGLRASVALTTERFSGHSTTGTLDPSYRSALVLELVQPLLRDFGTKANKAALDSAGYQLQQTELGYLLAAQHLAIQLEYGLRELVLSHWILQLRQDSLDLADDLLRNNHLRFEQGIVPITEIQEAESAQASRRLLLVQARQSRDRLFIEINRQLNNQLPEDFDPVGIFSQDDIDPYAVNTFDSLLTTARSKRLDLQISRLSLALQQRQRDAMRQQLKPQLDLRLQAGLNGLAGRQDADTAYSGTWSDSFSSLSSADGHQWGVAIEFSLPLGNRQAQSRFHQSRIATQQQGYELVDLDLQVQTEIKDALIRYQQASEQLDIATDVANLAAISLDQEQRRLAEGLSDTFRLLIFQENMIRAQIDRLQALVAYHSAQATVAFVTGEIFERYNIRLADDGEGFRL